MHPKINLLLETNSIVDEITLLSVQEQQQECVDTIKMFILKS